MAGWVVVDGGLLLLSLEVFGGGLTVFSATFILLMKIHTLHRIFLSTTVATPDEQV